MPYQSGIVNLLHLPVIEGPKEWLVIGSDQELVTPLGVELGLVDGACHPQALSLYGSIGSSLLLAVEGQPHHAHSPAGGAADGCDLQTSTVLLRNEVPNPQL